MSDTYKVRTTLQPDVELEVDLVEYRTLRSLGVIEKAPKSAAKDAARVATAAPATQEKE